MKSRITIEVDFNNGNAPVIQILQANSDDVRDNLLKNFCEQVGGSSWLKIKWMDGVSNADPNSLMFNRIFITPIKPENFQKEITIMQEQDKLNRDFKEKHLEVST